MEAITRNELLKQNAIKIAKHHKKCCEGEECDISLVLLLNLLQEAGIKVSHEEFEVFI